MSSEPERPLTGRVLRIGGGIYEVDTARGALQASLRGRVKNTDERIVSVGDLVELESVDDEVRISRVLPRESALTRHGVAKRREQVIVANVDQVAIVVSARSPEPDLLMVDRLLALAELSDIEGLLVLNKSDLVEAVSQEPSATSTSPEAGSATPTSATQMTTPSTPAPSSAVTPIEAYTRLGYEMLQTSATTGQGLETFSDRLERRITVLTGQSGVGKSSLLNSLLPGLDLRVGEINERRGRGRHTTVASALYPYPGGGYVADTPGLQYLALWGMDPATLQRGFVEIDEASAGCRFADCRHRAEPSCAVMEAVEAGDILVRRHESYLGLLEEAEGTRR